METTEHYKHKVSYWEGVLCNHSGHTPMKPALNDSTYVQCLKCSGYSKMLVIFIIFQGVQLESSIVPSPW